MKLSTILDAARNSVPADSEVRRRLLMELECITVAPGYAEPGYSCDKGVVFANWNKVKARDPQTGYWNKPAKGGGIMPRLSDILERAGYAVEWSDEWTTCSDCGRAVRTSPDCYHWAPSYKEGDGEILCVDCAPTDEEPNT